MSSPPAAYLLVDGHSVIFAWPELRALHDCNPQHARDMLCNRLRAYHDAAEENVVVVFDGKGPTVTSERAHPHDIQIIYAPADKTADSVIERLAAKYGETHRLTVATADRLEQMTVFSFGALCIDPAHLRERIERAEAQLQRQLKQIRRKR